MSSTYNSKDRNFDNLAEAKLRALADAKLMEQIRMAEQKIKLDILHENARIRNAALGINPYSGAISADATQNTLRPGVSHAYASSSVTTGTSASVRNEYPEPNVFTPKDVANALIHINNTMAPANLKPLRDVIDHFLAGNLTLTTPIHHATILASLIALPMVCSRFFMPDVSDDCTVTIGERRDSDGNVSAEVLVTSNSVLTAWAGASLKISIHLTGEEDLTNMELRHKFHAMLVDADAVPSEAKGSITELLPPGFFSGYGWGQQLYADRNSDTYTVTNPFSYPQQNDPVYLPGPNGASQHWPGPAGWGQLNQDNNGVTWTQQSIVDSWGVSQKATAPFARGPTKK